MAQHKSLNGMTAGELKKALESDPEWLEEKLKRDAERQLFAQRRNELIAPLEREIRDAGVHVESYRNVIDKPANFRAAIPILIRHMQMEKYPDLERNFMVQAIAMKEANQYWHDLVALFDSETARDTTSSYAAGLAVAIAKSYREPELQDLISLCANPAYGDHRLWFADSLRRSKSIRAESALMNLLSDPQIGKQVTQWMKKRASGNTTKH